MFDEDTGRARRFELFADFFTQVPTEEAEIAPDHESGQEATPIEEPILYTDILKEQITHALCEDTIFEADQKEPVSGISAELDVYVSRVMQNMTEDQLTDLEQSDYLYIQKIYNKVRQLLAAHAKDTFEK